MSGIELAQNSGLHDYELVSLMVDYTAATIALNMVSPMVDHVTSKVNILIPNFIDCSISCQEPWGKGRYIFSSEIQSIDPVTRKLEILLNSGDIIAIYYKN